MSTNVQGTQQLEIKIFYEAFPTKRILMKQHLAMTTNMSEMRDPPWHGFGSGAQNVEYGVISGDQVRTV
jgi:hypothetical protein